MKLLILKTDIATKNEVRLIHPVLNNHPVISKWSVDTEDVDHVLRIETSGDLDENEVISLVNQCGFRCDDLPE